MTSISPALAVPAHVRFSPTSQKAGHSPFPVGSLARASNCPYPWANSASCGCRVVIFALVYPHGPYQQVRPEPSRRAVRARWPMPSSCAFAVLSV